MELTSFAIVIRRINVSVYLKLHFFAFLINFIQLTFKLLNLKIAGILTEK